MIPGILLETSPLIISEKVKVETIFEEIKLRIENRSIMCSAAFQEYAEQAEAEVVPSSSLVEVEVEAVVELGVGFEVRVEVEVVVEV